MPLGTPGFYGTNADASENHEFCKMCFENGAYTQPELTVEQMVESSVHFMTNSLNFEETKARELSAGVIPHLKRWKVVPEA